MRTKLVGTILLLSVILLQQGCRARSASSVKLTPIASIVSTDGAGFEIPAYHHASSTLWVTRTDGPRLSRFRITADAAGSRDAKQLEDLDLSQFGSGVTSVAANNNLLAACLLAEPSTDVGTVVLLAPDGAVLAQAATGAHPDMVTFSPDGSLLLVANEGEPANGIDPPGSVSIFQINGGTLGESHTVTLGDPNADPADMRWTTPLAASPPKHVEPEYIACAPDGTRAFVSCQENNGIAVIDLTAWPPMLIDQLDLGQRSHADAFPIDIDDNDRFEPLLQPVHSLPQPDSIAAIDTPFGRRLLTADEGDPRDEWGTDGVTEINRTQVVRSAADAGQTLLFGSRSISLWSERGEFRSAVTSPVGLLSPDSPMTVAADARSDRRGSEPEGLVSWTMNDRLFVAFGLERVGGLGVIEIVNDQLLLRQLIQLPKRPNTQASSNRPASPEGIAIIAISDKDETAIIAVADERHGIITLLSVALVEHESTPGML